MTNLSIVSSGYLFRPESTKHISRMRWYGFRIVNYERLTMSTR
jgi:hypothetical protein